MKHNPEHQNEQLASLNAHHIRTRAGSCWLQRTGRDTSRHTAAGGQRSDSDPQHFFSTVSSAAEAAVLQGESQAADPLFAVRGLRRCQGRRGLQKSHPVKCPVRSRIQMSFSAQTPGMPLKHKRQHVTQD